MTSPPSLTQTIVDLSKLGKYSLDPGCAEVGGAFSLILAHNSCSFGFGNTSCMAGNGQRLQGSPGHKHPVQLACADRANAINHKLQTRTVIILPADLINISIPFINTLKHHPNHEYLF